MTTTIRARVWFEQCGNETCGCTTHPWMVRVSTRDEDTRLSEMRMSDQAATWPDAMHAAHRLLRILDRRLSDEVHESRSSRRAARVKQIADEAFGEQALAAAPPLTVPIIPLTPLAARIFGPASVTVPRRAGRGTAQFTELIANRFTTTDPHTMEATA